MYVKVEPPSFIFNDEVSATTSGNFVISQSRESMEGRWKCESQAPLMSSNEKNDYNFVYTTQLEIQSLFCLLYVSRLNLSFFEIF